LRAAGTRELLASGGPALGMWAGARFKAGATTIGPGDTLALYTDGVSEVMNAAGEMFGLDRLEDVVRRHADLPADAIVQSVVDATRAFAGRPGYEDDFTLVVVKRRAPAPAAPA